jgi:hypothetical protein
MAVGFLFLASSSWLDVLAGAAGFVAGAVLLAAGLGVQAALACSPVARATDVVAANGREFYRQVSIELSRFVRRLRTATAGAARSPAPVTELAGAASGFDIG